MKKYLLTSAAALAFCGLFTSCTHDLGYDESSAQNSVVKKYEQAFITAFGQPDPNQEWGFGISTQASTRAMTRALPDEPTFRDTNPISRPTTPTFYTTLTQAINAGAVFTGDKDWNNSQNGDVVYINSSNSNLPDNKELTVYVDGNVTCLAATYQGGNGVTFVVTENSTLKLGGVRQRVSVYLAPNAALDVTECLNWDGTPAYTEEYYPEYKRYKSVTFNFDNNYKEENPCMIYLSEGSRVTGTDLILTTGYRVLNAGGTIETENLTINNSYSALWNEGTVTVTGTLKTMNEDAHIYNAAGHTITAGNIDIINNNNLLYNDGTVTAGAIALQNNNAEIINNGTLTATSMDLAAGQAAGGKMHNVGTATISGTTYLTNTNSWWKNDGQYTSGTFEINNARQVYNNCKLTVLGNFHLKEGDFVLQGGDKAGASVICNSFTFELNPDFWMGSKSLLKVTNALHTLNFNSGYGIHGIGDQYAVIQAGSITKDADHQYSMSYFGNLFVDTQSHFPQGYVNKDGKQQPYYYYENSVKFSFTDPNDANVIATTSPVSIKQTECNPGYGNDPDPSYEGILRVVCEDLSVTQASDWDFNDVVFDVQLVDDNKQVKITLKAAGGTLPLCVGDDDSDNRTHEVHELFAKANPGKNITTSTMINTGHTGAKYTITGCKEASFYLTIKDEWKEGHSSGVALLKSVAKNIPIDVYKMVDGTKRWVPIEWKKGNPTAKMAFGQNYNWCDERISIQNTFKAEIDNSGQYVSTFDYFVKGILGDNWYKVEKVTQAQVEEFKNK